MQNNKNFDSELQAYFNSIKHSIKEEHVSYLKTHPQLRQIMNDFLSSCLLEQPENVYEYAKKFFSFFNHQKDVKQFKPLVVSGCSGVGKGTLINKLLEKYPNLFELSVSYTTRRPRVGEVHGRQYYFVTIDQFKKQIQKKVFAEYCEVHGNFYGTHKGIVNDCISRGKICILDIDVQGAEKFHNNDMDCHYIFIDAQSMEVLEERLSKRGTESPQVIAKRLNNAKVEVQKSKELNFYNRFQNTELEACFDKIWTFIRQNYELPKME